MAFIDYLPAALVVDMKTHINLLSACHQSIQAYLVDEEEGLLVCEYLSGYTALSDFLTRGEYGHPTVPTKVVRQKKIDHSLR